MHFPPWMEMRKIPTMLKMNNIFLILFYEDYFLLVKYLILLQKLDDVCDVTLSKY